MTIAPETLQAVASAWRFPVEKLALAVKEPAKEVPQRGLAIVHCNESKLVTHMLGQGESSHTPRAAAWVVKQWQDWQALQTSQAVAPAAAVKGKKAPEKSEAT